VAKNFIYDEIKRVLKTYAMRVICFVVTAAMQPLLLEKGNEEFHSIGPIKTSRTYHH
jgi:hypothetical protein